VVFKNYLEKKLKKLIKIEKVGDKYAFVVRKFSSEDGSELKPDIIEINIDELVEMKKILQEYISNVDSILEDINKLEQGEGDGTR